MVKGNSMKSKRIVKEIAEGVLLGVMILGTLIVSVKINAAANPADTLLKAEYIGYCEDIGSRYSICPELLEAIIEEESDGDADAVGSAGEIGLMQVYPKYHMERAERLGIYSLFNPRDNILTGADYLSELFKEYQDMGTVLMVYNGTADATGLGAKGKYSNYAEKIMERTEQLERLHGK